MSNSVPPGSSNSNPNEETNLVPTSRSSRPVEAEEWWAIVIAILAMGGIFWWTIGRSQFSLSFLSSATDDSSAEVTGGAPNQEFNGADGGAQNGADGGLLRGIGAVGGGIGFGGGDAGNGAGDGAGGEGSVVDGAGGNGAESVDGDGDDGGDRREVASEANSPTRGDVPPPPSEAVDSTATEGGTTPDAAPPSPPPAPQAFDDVPDDHWAAPFVNQVTQLGFIEGFPDNTFQPDAPVNRAQLAAIVAKAYSDRQPTAPATPFSDIAADFWGTEAVAKTVQMEFMKGYPNATFDPERPIPRLEALLTFVSGLKLKPQGNPDEVLGQFPDGDQVPGWARPAIAAAVENRLLANPEAQTLDLQTPATRADIAVMSYQALTSENKVGPVESPHILGTK
ncbi:MAG: S-layer homology domain-containing protein [Cyanophyceae cyanobacterium]